MYIENMIEEIVNKAEFISIENKKSFKKDEYPPKLHLDIFINETMLKNMWQFKRLLTPQFVMNNKNEKLITVKKEIVVLDKKYFNELISKIEKIN